MTTNSPNPVDGDVQALIEHINTQLDLLRNVTIKHVDEFQIEDIKMDIRVHEIALAALTAVPEYNTSDEYGEIYLDVRKDRYDECHEDHRWISYSAPPAQLLRPVELPRISDLIDSSEGIPNVRVVAIWDSAVTKCAELLRQQGYEVKS